VRCSPCSLSCLMSWTPPKKYSLPLGFPFFSTFLPAKPPSASGVAALVPTPFANPFPRGDCLYSFPDEDTNSSPRHSFRDHCLSLKRIFSNSPPTLLPLPHNSMYPEIHTRSSIFSLVRVAGVILSPLMDSTNPGRATPVSGILL